MNNSITTLEQPRPTTNASSAKKIATVCAILIVVRVYLYWVRKQAFSPINVSLSSTLATTFAVVVIAFIATILAQKWFGKLISFLSSIAFGAIAGAHSNSTYGAMIGAMVGFFVVFDLPRKCFWIATRWFVRFGMAAFALGGASSFLFLRLVDVQDRNIQVAITLSSLSVCLLIGTVVYLLKKNSGSGWKRFYETTCSFLAMFLLLVVGWTLGIEAVNQSSYRQLESTSGSASIDPATPNQWLTHGMTTCRFANIGQKGTDQSMMALNKMQGLVGFSIDSEYITDVGMKFVPRNPRLEWISIRNAKITDDAFKALRFSRAVYSINIAHLDIGDEAIENMGFKPFLERLYLDHTNITDRSMKTFGSYRRLNNLSLRGTQVTDSGLAEVTNPSLSKIDLSHTPIEGPGLRHLAKLPNLQWIDLSYTQLKPQFLGLLASSRSVSNLILDGVQIDERSVAALQQRLMINRLSLCDTGITDENARRLPPIEDLTIDCLNLTPSTVQMLLQRQNVAAYTSQFELRLDNQQVSPEWVERMSQFGVEVVCSNCSVDLAAIQALEEHSNSIDIHFENLKIDDELYPRLHRILGVSIGSRHEP